MPVFNHEILWFPAILESYLSKRKSEFGNKMHLALLIEWKQEKLTRNPKQEAFKSFSFSLVVTVLGNTLLIQEFGEIMSNFYCPLD